MIETPATANDLQILTARFLGLHWCEQLGPAPAWLEVDPLAPSALLDAGGCYSVADPNGVLLYVGLALAEKKAGKPQARGGIVRRLFRHVIRRGALSKGRFEAKRVAWMDHGGIGSIWILAFPDHCSYLTAALELFLIQELSGRLPLNKSRVRTKLATT